MSNYENTKAWRAKQPDIKRIRAEEARKWRARHPEVAAAIQQHYREKNLHQMRERNRLAKTARRIQDPEGARRRAQAYAKRQEEKRIAIAGRPKSKVCEICGERGTRIVFDHCHKHNCFRGWLCDRCNRILGSVKDETALLEKMIRYLKGAEEKYGEINSSCQECDTQRGVCGT